MHSIVSVGASSFVVWRHDRLWAARPDTILWKAEQRRQHLHSVVQQQSSIQSSAHISEEQPQPWIGLDGCLLAPPEFWPASGQSYQYAVRVQKGHREHLRDCSKLLSVRQATKYHVLIRLWIFGPFQRNKKQHILNTDEMHRLGSRVSG